MRNLKKIIYKRLYIDKIFLLILSSLLFVSCSPHKNIAYNFVKKSKGASVAFYLPDELKKINIREDCNPENDDLAALDENQLNDTINARTKIVNKIDDEIFLDVLYASFKETMKDYNIEIEYWEDGNQKPDSLHWVIDLSHIEVQELIMLIASYCGSENNYEFLPFTNVNVASWFELINSENSNFLFSEQNYEEYIVDCYYTLDTINNYVRNIEYHDVTIDGFYDYAVMLGRLYAGYTYDFFMNDYVKKEMMKKEKDYDEEYMYLRYDPYESFIYGTYKDKLIRIEK